MTSDRVIGVKGKLPWRIKADLRWFRQRTLHKPCIMGRKTWDTLPRRPLADRKNIVVTRDDNFIAQGAETAVSPENAICIAEEDKPDEIMLLGGGEIYRATLPVTDRIYVTWVKGDFEGDAYYPEFEDQFRLTTRQHGAFREEGEPEFEFCIYDRV